MLARKYPQATSNARAQILAQKYGASVLQKLDKEDKSTLPSGDVRVFQPITEAAKIKRVASKKIKPYFHYSTNDFFVKGHINELNRAFASRCYTCVFILARKIIENLIAAILKKKFPRQQSLYWNQTEGHFYDFSILLDNLFKKRTLFGTEKQLVEKLFQLAKRFRKDGNNKAHSLYHLVKNPKEVKDAEIQYILNLIVKLETVLKIK